MNTQDALTKVLAVIGTALAMFPLLAPLLLSLLVLIAEGQARLDYLMPAELFLLALAGGGLLVWAALRMKAHLALISGSLAAAVLLLFGSQGLAVATGLASGAIRPEGWPFVLVLTMLAGYTLALIGQAAGGVLLIRDLWRPPQRIKPA